VTSKQPLNKYKLQWYILIQEVFLIAEAKEYTCDRCLRFYKKTCMQATPNLVSFIS